MLLLFFPGKVNHGKLESLNVLPGHADVADTGSQVAAARQLDAPLTDGRRDASC